MAKTLGAYTALLSIQDLLLEELSESETLTRLACVQILESHSSELQELERKLEDALGHQETAQLQRALDSQQRWAGSRPGLLNEPEDADSERQVSTVLPRALSKSHRLLEHHQQSLREERESSAVLEDLLENMEMDTFATLYGQELRLASYLSRLTMVPAGVLHRLLSVALPAASQPELLAMLDAVGQKHADHAEQSDSRGEQADPGRRRKHQGWWQALESKLRGELISEGLEKMLWARRKKESILKKTCPPLRERVAFSGEGHWPHLSLEPLGELAPVSIVGAETVDLLNTGEKLFIFRNPREPEISLHVPPRRKKKNFLNARKAAWALGMD
ncbi:limbin-like [Pteropus vampyrus]|uniref:Limbin-like n=1 Tax=Pteropus vampyrus TaxID=132908 RepID=A0A6P6BLM2_PTEVA|nr:limbin-like [Pteropus vampyrus]